ncbi:MAG: hypothetical protein R3F28_12170 [Candidatus Kapaibacterium sp.]
MKDFKLDYLLLSIVAIIAFLLGAIIRVVIEQGYTFSNSIGLSNIFEWIFMLIIGGLFAHKIAETNRTVQEVSANKKELRNTTAQHCRTLIDKFKESKQLNDLVKTYKNEYQNIDNGRTVAFNNVSISTVQFINKLETEWRTIVHSLTTHSQAFLTWRIHNKETMPKSGDYEMLSFWSNRTFETLEKLYNMAVVIYTLDQKSPVSKYDINDKKLPLPTAYREHLRSTLDELTKCIQAVIDDLSSKQ